MKRKVTFKSTVFLIGFISLLIFAHTVRGEEPSQSRQKKIDFQILDPVEPSPSQPQYVDIDEIQDEPDRPELTQPESYESFEDESKPVVVPESPAPQPEPCPTPQSEKPPFKIESIPQPDSQSSDEFTQTTSESDEPESTQTDYGLDRF
jgi:hypothetical protein